MSKTPTQNDWKKEIKHQVFKAFLLNAGGTKNHKKYSRKITRLVKKELADARREVIDSIHDKFCEFAIQGGDDEQAQKGILLYARTLQYLATLRKEGK